jgi:acyl-CoA synthetase (AMP-forming)/AMP-acid ligase II
MIASLVEAAGDQPSPAPSMKQVSYGGAPISASLLRRATEVFGSIFVQVYGSCEAPHPLSILTRADHLELTEAKAASIGRETLGIELRIVGPDGPVPVGEPGELQVRGPSIMIGYWENPAATREALVDGWYRTGDVATRDAGGYYAIVDRQRDMIITGGLNVYPAEVERAISQLEGVNEVAVIGIPDDKWGEAVTAFIAAEPNANLTEELVVDHCRRLLAGYKKPRRVEFRDDLPKGPTGKILKRALRDRFWQGAERMVG